MLNRMLSGKSAMTAARPAAFHRRSVAYGLVLGLLATIGAQIPVAAQTIVSATVLRAVKSVRQGVATSTGSTAFVNVPGATATFTVPAATRDVFIARFTAESVCSGVSGWCPVRILINGSEMDPVVGSDFAFDSTEAGTASTSSWE